MSEFINLPPHQNWSWTMLTINVTGPFNSPPPSVYKLGTTYIYWHIPSALATPVPSRIGPKPSQKSSNAYMLVLLANRIGASTTNSAKHTPKWNPQKCTDIIPLIYSIPRICRVYTPLYTPHIDRLFQWGPGQREAVSKNRSHFL